MELVSPFVSTPYTNAIELQKEADKLREEGQSVKAINAYNQAIVRYQENRDYQNMMGALTGRLLSWKHLFYKTGDKIYAITVKNEAEAMFEIAKEYQLMNMFYLTHFLKGTSAVLLNDYSMAEKEFDQAIKLFPHENGEKGDWVAHLGEAIYQNGRKKEGKEMILLGIQKIKENSFQTDPFLVKVWISGAYLRLAKLLKSEDAEQSKIFYDEAKKIIVSDEKLVIRNQQLDAFLNE